MIIISLLMIITSYIIIHHIDSIITFDYFMIWWFDVDDHSIINHIFIVSLQFDDLIHIMMIWWYDVHLMYMNETFHGFHNSWMFRWSSSAVDSVDVGSMHRWGIEPAKHQSANLELSAPFRHLPIIFHFFSSNYQITIILFFNAHMWDKQNLSNMVHVIWIHMA